MVAARKALSEAQRRWRRSKKSRSQYASEGRMRLVAEISPPNEHGSIACAGACGRRYHASELEIDHVDGRTWEARSKSSWVRLATYRRELREGVRLRVLCRSCNAKDGNRKKWARRYGA